MSTPTSAPVPVAPAASGSAIVADGATDRPPRPAGPGRPPRGGVVGLYVALSLGLVVMIAPFVWMLFGSFKTDGELRQTPPTLWPTAPTTSNYSELLDKQSFSLYFGNSVLVAAAVVLGNLVLASMTGYALAKLKFGGARLVFALVLATLMVPGMATFIPQFVLVSNLNLTNTYPGLFLPFLVTPVGIFLMRQFISSLPDELIQAARVDGAGEFRIFFRIILPLCGPALAALSIITFFASWNNFLWPLVVAQTEDKYTLPIALALFSTGQNEAKYGLLLAGATIVALPVIALFLVLQRYFTQGVATTGLK